MQCIFHDVKLQLVWPLGWKPLSPQFNENSVLMYNWHLLDDLSFFPVNYYPASILHWNCFQSVKISQQHTKQNLVSCKWVSDIFGELRCVKFLSLPWKWHYLILPIQFLIQKYTYIWWKNILVYVWLFDNIYVHADILTHF